VILIAVEVLTRKQIYWLSNAARSSARFVRWKVKVRALVLPTCNTEAMNLHLAEIDLPEYRLTHTKWQRRVVRLSLRADLQRTSRNRAPVASRDWNRYRGRSNPPLSLAGGPTKKHDVPADHLLYTTNRSAPRILSR
jgi:hypothetical protein